MIGPDRSIPPINVDDPEPTKRQLVLSAFSKTAGLLRVETGDTFKITEERSSGIKVNMKEAWDNPLLLRDTALLLHEMIGTDTVHTVVGIESGGSPLATLLSNRLPAKLRLVRKQQTELKDVLAGASDHYVGNVLVIDDVLGRGDSLIRTLGSVASFADDAAFISIFSYGSERRLQTELGIKVESLFQVADLVEMIPVESEREIAQEQLAIYQQKIGVNG
jgi:orotate phosphoribosyltransferase